MAVSITVDLDQKQRSMAMWSPKINVFEKRYLGYIWRTETSNFVNKLYDLAGICDKENYTRLALAFPMYFTPVEDWKNGKLQAKLVRVIEEQVYECPSCGNTCNKCAYQCGHPHDGS